MNYKQSDFIVYSSDAQRAAANLEQGYTAWLNTERALSDMPASMYWAVKNATDYLTAKLDSTDSGTSMGVRSDVTEAKFANYISEKSALEERHLQQTAILTQRIAIYRTRALQLPQMADDPAEILRKLDVEELLGNDVIVVGTNAFAAYELACGVRFPVGNEPTQDFDMAWCRKRKASLLAKQSITLDKPRKTIFSLLREIDKSYRINPKRPYQAINADLYEVELLAAPSTHPLPKAEAFDPMASLIEQEWLLLGQPISVVAATQRGRVCPLVVPDPRWMALHKLWLADKPERKASKREKDRRQGYVLLDAVRFFMQASHPINVEFALDVPAELRHIFDDWCALTHYVPER